MPYLHYISDHHCDACETKSMFHLLYAAPLTEVKEKEGGRRAWRESSSEFRGLFTCGHCKNPHMIELVVRRPAGNISNLLSSLNRLTPLEVDVKGRSPARTSVMSVTADHLGIDLRQVMDIRGTYPNQALDVPSDLPESLEILYREFDELARAPRYTVAHCRRIVEAICHHQLGETKGNLKDKIEQLHKSGRLPESIADWAHHIRDFGNEAVHQDDRPSEETAQELREYVGILLEILYSYPERIKRLNASPEEHLS